MPLNGLFEEKLTTPLRGRCRFSECRYVQSQLNLAYIDVVIKVYCAVKTLPGQWNGLVQNRPHLPFLEVNFSPSNYHHNLLCEQLSPHNINSDLHDAKSPTYPIAPTNPFFIHKCCACSALENSKRSIPGKNQAWQEN